MPSSRKAARRRRQPRFGAETVGALILAYKASPEWLRLSPATKALAGEAVALFENAKSTRFANRLQTGPQKKAAPRSK